MESWIFLVHEKIEGVLSASAYMFLDFSIAFKSFSLTQSGWFFEVHCQMWRSGKRRMKVTQWRQKLSSTDFYCIQGELVLLLAKSLIETNCEICPLVIPSSSLTTTVLTVWQVILIWVKLESCYPQNYSVLTSVKKNTKLGELKQFTELIKTDQLI